MATNKINVDLIVSSNGTLQQATKDAEKLNSTLGRTTSSAAKASKSLAAAKDRSRGVTDSEQHDQARAAVGTGAAGRDFAKQSQGLGGLVRLYATFAANLFAVSAAYTALRRAADTTNLVEGLNQLGAASGRNLGSIAKQIVSVTDNAVSLREAMTATAQTTSAGLGTENILRLARGAKNASQALGIDMPDALSRLSRGVTKLEPELLDELGIFVRVDKASQDYARSIGKSALSLTDFEKRAAFANAVLDQVDEKFGKLEIPANPYTQLLASLKNVTTAGLELVNKVMGPLVSALATSPTALSVALAGIAAILIKQAIPAIGAFRANLRDAAEESATKAASIKDTFDAVKESRANELKNSLSAAVKAEGVKAEKAIQAARKALGNDAIKRFGIVKSIISQDIKDVSAADLKVLDKAALKKSNEILNNPNLEKAKIDALKQQKVAFEELARSIRTAQAAQEAYNRVADPEIQGKFKKAGLFSHERQIAINAERAARAAQSNRLLSNVAENTADLGAISALKSFRIEMAAATVQMNGFQRALLFARAGLTAFATAATTAIAAFSTWIFIIGAVVSGITLLVQWGRKNTEQAEKTTEALTTLDEASKNVARTLDVIAKKDPLEKLNISSITARATALDELSNSMIEAFDRANKEIASRNWVDATTNWVANIFGNSTEKQLADKMAKGISSAIKASSNSAQSEELVARIAAELGTASTNANDILKAITDPKAPVALERIIELVKKLSKENKAAANSLKEVADGFTAIARQQSEFVASQNTNDAEAKIAVGMLTQLAKLDRALKKPVENLALFVELANDINKLSLFPSKNSAEILKFSSELENIQTALAKTTERSKALKQEIIDLQSKTLTNSNTKGVETEGGAYIGFQRISNKVQGALSNLDTINLENRKKEQQALDKTAESLKARIQEISLVFDRSSKAAFDANTKVIEQRIAAGFQAGALTIQKAYASAISDTLPGIQLSGKLDRESLNVQINQLTATIQLIKALKQNELAIEQNSIDLQLANGDRFDRQLLAPRQKQVDVQRNILNANNPLAAFSAASKGDDASKLAASNMADFVTSLSAVKSKLSEAFASIKASNIQEVFKSIDKETSNYAENVSNSIKVLDTEKSILELRKQSGSITEVEALKAIQNIELKKNELDYDRELLKLSGERIKMVTALEASQKESRNRGSGADNSQFFERAIKEQDEKIAKFKNTSREQEKSIALANSVAIANAEIQEARRVHEYKLSLSRESESAASKLATLENDNAITKLDILKAQGRLTEDEYNSKKAILETDKTSLEFAIGKTEAQIKLTNALNEIEDKRAKAIASAGEGGLSASVSQQFERDTMLQQVYYDNQIKYLERVKQLKLEDIELTNSMDERTKKFNEFFENAVGDWTDAMVDFALTGKQSFGDMIKSMVADLIKLEIRHNMMNATKGALSAGVPSTGGGILGSLFKGVTSIFTGGSSAAMPLTAGLVQAKGGMWDGGVQKFAKGAPFTNSIVSSPTLFKFSKGTGMMGEAGPEAIMPLKRDKQGNLGVSGGESKTIQINNTFTINGPTDRRSQQQIAAAAAKGAQSAMARNY